MPSSTTQLNHIVVYLHQKCNNFIKNAIANQVTDRDRKQSRARKGAVEPRIVEVFRERDRTLPGAALSCPSVTCHAPGVGCCLD